MDKAHRSTEREIARVEGRIRRVYGRAYRDAKRDQAKMLEEYSKELERRKKALDGSDAAKRSFDDWKRLEAVRIAANSQNIDMLAIGITQANVRAREIVHGVMPGVYAKNYSFAFNDIMAQVPEAAMSFALVDERTVRKLITENPSLLPIPEAGDPVVYSKAIAWNRRHIQTEITQGILKGESATQVAERLLTVTNQDMRAAMRYARTASTYAQNLGRLQSYHDAEDMGIELVKEWIATGDNRVRDTHLAADGQQKPVDEPFDVGDAKMMEPGDPAGGGEAWNCRCTMRSRVKGAGKSDTAKQHREEIKAERKRRR